MQIDLCCQRKPALWFDLLRQFRFLWLKIWQFFCCLCVYTLKKTRIQCLVLEVIFTITVGDSSCKLSSKPYIKELIVSFHPFNPRCCARTAWVGLVVTGRWIGGGQRLTLPLPTEESVVREMGMNAVWAGTTSPGVCTALTPNSPLCTIIRAQIFQLQCHPVLVSTWIM